MMTIGGFIARNPEYSFSNIRRLWTVRKAMNIHRKANPICAACDSEKKLHVHHRVPVHVNPLLADQSDNFVTLCKYCHFTLGHSNKWKSHVPFIMSLIACFRGSRIKGGIEKNDD